MLKTLRKKDPVIESFENYFVSGGDDRIITRDNGLNKYFMNPVDFKHRINRGSCTCSALTHDAYHHCLKVYKRMTHGNVGFTAVRERQIRFIKRLLGPSLGQKIDIIAAPSGSDLCFLPPLIAKWLEPEKPILHLVSCPEELGTGSVIAGECKYHGNMNQFEEPVKYNTPLSPHINVKQIFYPARDQKGNIYDVMTPMAEDLERYHKNNFIIGTLVVGSKSGIRNNISIVKEFPENALWSVDICQLRVSTELIHELIDHGAVVMLTGSKFYQAPPFCGALLMPKTLTEKLNDRPLDEKYLKAFYNVFAEQDFPASLNLPTGVLRDFQNIGLLLRWEAAVYEMTFYQREREEADHTIEVWHKYVLSFLEKNDHIFKPMPDWDRTNKSIISFKVKNYRTGDFFSFEECQAMYKELMLSRVKVAGEYYKPSIGQPVKYLNGAFLRLALGSRDARGIIADGDLRKDKALLEHLKKMSMNFAESSLLIKDKT